MAVTTYSPPAGRVILNTWAALGSRCVPQRVYLMQYDEGLPVVACALYKDGQPFAVPTGADVRLRMDKGGYPVYHDALGVSAARTVAYFEITAQMTALYGDFAAVIEVETADGDTAGTGYLRLEVRKNPVQEPDLSNLPEYTANAAKLTAAGVAAMQAESEKQQKAVADKGAATLASIPEEYGALSGDVGRLKKVATQEIAIDTAINLVKGYATDKVINTSDSRYCRTRFLHANSTVRIRILNETYQFAVAIYTAASSGSGESYQEYSARDKTVPAGKYYILTVKSADGAAIDAADYAAIANELLVYVAAANTACITPQAFDAVGDGEHDDTAAFAECLKTGQNLYIPAGTYKLTSELVLPKNIKISGAGTDKTVLVGYHNGFIFKYLAGYDYSAYDCEISGIKFSAGENYKPGGIAFYSGISVKNVYFYKLKQALKKAANKYMDMVQLERVTVSYCVPEDDYTISIVGNGDALDINQLKFESFKLEETSLYNGVKITNCHGGAIRNSIINAPVVLEDVNSFSLENNHLENTNMAVEISGADVAFRNNFIFKNNNETPDILIKAATNKPSHVVLEDTLFYLTGDRFGAVSALAPEIKTEGDASLIRITHFNNFRCFNFADIESIGRTNLLFLPILGDAPLAQLGDYANGKRAELSAKRENEAVTATLSETTAFKWSAEDAGSMSYRVYYTDSAYIELSGGAKTKSGNANLIAVTGAVDTLTIYRDHGSGFHEKCVVPIRMGNLLIDNGLSVMGYPWQA